MLCTLSDLSFTLLQAALLSDLSVLLKLVLPFLFCTMLFSRFVLRQFAVPCFFHFRIFSHWYFIQGTSQRLIVKIADGAAAKLNRQLIAPRPTASSLFLPAAPPTPPSCYMPRSTFASKLSALPFSSSSVSAPLALLPNHFDRDLDASSSVPPNVNDLDDEALLDRNSVPFVGSSKTRGRQRSLDLDRSSDGNPVNAACSFMNKLTLNSPDTPPSPRTASTAPPVTASELAFDLQHATVGHDPKSLRASASCFIPEQKIPLRDDQEQLLSEQFQYQLENRQKLRHQLQSGQNVPQHQPQLHQQNLFRSGSVPTLSSSSSSHATALPLIDTGSPEPPFLQAPSPSN